MSRGTPSLDQSSPDLGLGSATPAGRSPPRWSDSGNVVGATRCVGALRLRCAWCDARCRGWRGATSKLRRLRSGKAPSRPGSWARDRASSSRRRSTRARVLDVTQHRHGRPRSAETKASTGSPAPLRSSADGRSALGSARAAASRSRHGWYNRHLHPEAAPTRGLDWVGAPGLLPAPSSAPDARNAHRLSVLGQSVRSR